MGLAWRNLCHERTRFAVTLCGISFAVLLMVLQGSLLTGFMRSASRVIDASDAEFWIVAKGVACFECATPVPARFREIALGIPGVIAVERVVAGAAVWKKPSGKSQLVYVVGTEHGAGREFPLPYLSGSEGPLKPEMVMLDESNAELLEVSGAGIGVEINRRQASVAEVISDFGSFIGQPYMFTTYRDAVQYLGLSGEDVHFLAVHASTGSSLARIQSELQSRMPEVNVWRREEFAWEAQTYWTMLTGAGSAILTAAFLGFVVGTVVVSQTIYATTMENLEEFATLKAMGASRFYIQRIVLTQAWISGSIGALIGVSITIPLVRLVKQSIAWVYMPWWMPVSMVAVTLGMCSLAAIVSVRKAVSVEPARVFRA